MPRTARTTVLYVIQLLLVGSSLSTVAGSRDEEAANRYSGGPIDMGWLDEMSDDDRARYERHIRLGLPINTHPRMAMTTMGFDYEPIRDLPLAVFHNELQAINEGVGEALIHLFNIQLICPRYDVDFPSDATLHVDFSKRGKRTSIEAPMVLRSDSIYYLKRPSSVLSDLIDVVNELGPYPQMVLTELEGFEFNEQTIADMPPLGVAITYNIRFGSVRVDTGFQWAGRPPSFPLNGGEDFLK